jgi:hypothetical protein
MTTLVAVNTRDTIVMGSDSLGTVTKQIVDPGDLAGYFEKDRDFKIKLGPDGTPLLNDWSRIMQKSQTVPCNYYAHVEKIFPLAPLDMGVMCSGVGALGDRSLKSLIREFSLRDETLKLKGSDYTLFTVGEQLLQFLWAHYRQAFPDGQPHPDLELMLCG